MSPFDMVIVCNGIVPSGSFCYTWILAKLKQELCKFWAFFWPLPPVVVTTDYPFPKPYTSNMVNLTSNFQRLFFNTDC